MWSNGTFSFHFCYSFHNSSPKGFLALWQKIRRGNIFSSVRSSLSLSSLVLRSLQEETTLSAPFGCVLHCHPQKNQIFICFSNRGENLIFLPANSLQPDDEARKKGQNEQKFEFFFHPAYSTSFNFHPSDPSLAIITPSRLPHTTFTHTQTFQSFEMNKFQIFERGYLCCNYENSKFTRFSFNFS